MPGRNAFFKNYHYYKNNEKLLFDRIHRWSSEDSYYDGDITNYNGILYKCIAEDASSTLKEPTVTTGWASDWIKFTGIELKDVKGIIHAIDIEDVSSTVTETIEHDLDTDKLFVYSRDLIDRETVIPEVSISNRSEISVGFGENHSYVRVNILPIEADHTFNYTTISAGSAQTFEHNLNDNIYVPFCRDIATGELFFPDVEGITRSDVTLNFEDNHASIDLNFITRDLFNEYVQVNDSIDGSKRIDVYHKLNNLDYFAFATDGSDVILPGTYNVSSDNCRLLFDQAYSSLSMVIAGYSDSRDQGIMTKTGYGRERGLILTSRDGSEWTLIADNDGVLTTSKIWG